MATDYTKKKVDELQDLLKARSLSHTGKKAELVARLQQDDSSKEQKTSAPKGAAAASAPAPAQTGTEDEINWEDDAAAATESGAAAIAAGGVGQPANPTAVPNQVIDTDPSKTEDLKVDQAAPNTTSSAAAAEKAALAQDFSSNIPSTTLDAELEKRKQRATRFGITESNEDALKAIERAKKFGTGSADDKVAVHGLDEALPERRPKRGRGTDGDAGREGKRSRVRGEGGGRPAKSGGGSGLSEKDRQAAEARAKRFAT